MTLNEEEKRRLLQTLQDDSAFLAQVRSLILTEELVQLPERFAQFASHVMAFIERSGRVQLARRKSSTPESPTASSASPTTWDDLKGHVAGRVAREMADDIAEHLGFEIIQQLNGNDLRQLLRQQKPADISPGVRRSFYLADLVAKVEDQVRQPALHRRRGIIYRPTNAIPNAPSETPSS